MLASNMLLPRRSFSPTQMHQLLHVVSLSIIIFFTYEKQEWPILPSSASFLCRQWQYLGLASIAKSLRQKQNLKVSYLLVLSL